MVQGHIPSSPSLLASKQMTYSLFIIDDIFDTLGSLSELLVIYTALAHVRQGRFPWAVTSAKNAILVSAY